MVAHTGRGHVGEIVTLRALMGLVFSGVCQTKAGLLSVQENSSACSFALLSELHSVTLSIFSL